MITTGFGSAYELRNDRLAVVFVRSNSDNLIEVRSITAGYYYLFGVDGTGNLAQPANTLVWGRLVAATIQGTELVANADTMLPRPDCSSDVLRQNYGLARILLDVPLSGLGPFHLPFGDDSFLVAQREESLVVMLLPGYQVGSFFAAPPNIIGKGLSVTGNQTFTAKDKLLQRTVPKSVL